MSARAAVVHDEIQTSEDVGQIRPIFHDGLYFFG